MRTESLNALFRSFEKLESALDAAEEISSNTHDSDLLRRLKSYRESLAKQKSLARALAEQVSDGNFSQIRRNIDLIREHSSMIRDDAREAIGNRRSPLLEAPLDLSQLH